MKKMKKKLSGLMLLLTLFTGTIYSQNEKITISESNSKNSNVISNDKSLSKTEFFVEGQDDSQMKLKIEFVNDKEITVKVFKNNGKLVYSKIINKRGIYYIYVDTEENERYKVLIESSDPANFIVDKLDYL